MAGIPYRGRCQNFSYWSLGQGSVHQISAKFTCSFLKYFADKRNNDGETHVPTNVTGRGNERTSACVTTPTEASAARSHTNTLTNVLQWDNKYQSQTVPQNYKLWLKRWIRFYQRETGTMYPHNTAREELNSWNPHEIDIITAQCQVRIKWIFTIHMAMCSHKCNCSLLGYNIKWAVLS